MQNIWAVCFNSVDTGMCVLGVHDTTAAYTPLSVLFRLKPIQFQSPLFFSLRGGSQLHTTHPTARAVGGERDKKNACDSQTVSFLFKTAIQPKAFYLI